MSEEQTDRGDRIRRRDLLALVTGALAWPARAQAQALRRVAYLTGGALGGEGVSILKDGLAKLGWIEGRNVAFEWHAARGGDSRPLAAALVGSKPDLIISNGTPALRALQQATQSIPIVFVFLADPVGDGFVASLSRPGGNITGFSTYDPGLSGKWVELLHKAAPNIRRVAVVFNPETAPHSVFLGPLLASATSFGLEPQEARVHSPGDIERVLTEFAAVGAGGVIAMPDGFTSVHRALLTGVAARLRLPAIYPFRFYAVSGGLFSYGADETEWFRRAPSYVDRLLRGESPAELPVQGPTKFELILNLKTARELGLEMPPSLLAQADEVIE